MLKAKVFQLLPVTWKTVISVTISVPVHAGWIWITIIITHMIMTIITGIHMATIMIMTTTIIPIRTPSIR